MTGAQVIVGALEDAGVEVVFGLPGVHNLALWEALRESPVRLVGVRHEQAAAYAADGYARATGRVGVALTTTGPGAANTLGAVGEAFASRSGILVIATEIPSTLKRAGVVRGVLHESVDQASMFSSVTAAQFLGVEGVRDAIAAAAVLSRPVYLEIPTDQLRQSASAPTEPRRTASERRKDTDAVAADRQSVDAERPLIWVEDADRRDEVVEHAERLGAPVIEGYSGRGAMPLGHPLRVGFPPHMPSVGALWDQADVVIAFGARLDGMNTQNFAMPQPPRLIAVGEAGPNYAAEPASRVEGEGEPWADLSAVRSDACRVLDARALRFLDAIEYALPQDANVVCDMCIPGYWIGGFHPFPAPRKLLYPVGWGTLGFAFPAAIGTALAGTGPTVAICGDGGFLFACGELATVAQEQIPLTTVIVDDGGYGMLRFDQDQAGEPRFGVDLQTPDFERLAASFGLISDTVEGLDDAFGEALERHAGDPTPSVLVVQAEALVPPPTTSPQWYRARR